MKQVTIDTVRERISELEMVNSHGELSLRGEFELACLRMLTASHEREKVRAMHAVWSQATFGDVGPIGPLKHLAKEAMEAAAAPGDLSEWADMQFLLWDAQRRAGITDEQITQAMIDKLAVNKARQWPEPKDGEPRLHIQAENDTTAQQFEALAGINANKHHGKWVNCSERLPDRFRDVPVMLSDGSQRVGRINHKDTWLIASYHQTKHQYTGDVVMWFDTPNPTSAGSGKQ